MLKIEPNNIYLGDCLEILPQMSDKSVDMILCDLPYEITSCAWDKIIPIDDLWREYNRIIKDNGAVVLTSTMKFAVALINANLKNFRYDIVWEKSMSVGFANSHKMPMRKHETILVFYKHLPTYNPQGLIPLEKPQKTAKGRGQHNSVYRDGSLAAGYIKTHTNYPTSILKFANGNHKSLHPTQKTVALFVFVK